MALSACVVVCATLHCGGSKQQSGSGTCADVARHVSTMTRQDLETIASKEAKALLTAIPELESRLNAKCEQEKWSDKLRACILRSNTRSQGELCAKLPAPAKANTPAKPASSTGAKTVAPTRATPPPSGGTPPPSGGTPKPPGAAKTPPGSTGPAARAADTKGAASPTPPTKENASPQGASNK